MIVLPPPAALRYAVPPRGGPRAERRDRRPRRRAALRRHAHHPGGAAARCAARALAALAARCSSRAYYVLTTAALAAGLVDHLRHGTEAGLGPAGGNAVSDGESGAPSTCWWPGQRCSSPRRWLALAMVVIRIESHGHPIYRPAPRGQGAGHAFRGLQAAHDGLRRRADGRGGSPSTADDTRITRAGRFLRRTSLDEIPNLVNVLRGERWRSSARGRRCRSRSTSTPSASAAGSPSSRASPAGAQVNGPRVAAVG